MSVKVEMKVVTVTLNPAVDKTVIVPNFRPERVVRAKEVYIYPSGKGVNVARVLVRLGVKAICLGFVGGHFGTFLVDGLTCEGIEHDFTTVSDETRINLTIRDPETGLEVHLVEPGARVSERDWQRFVETYQRHISDASWVAFCGSLPPGAPTDAYAQLIRIARGRGIPCALDTSGEALRKGVEALPTLVKPNRQELEDLVGEKLDSDEKLRSAILQTHKLGLDLVVVSLGKEGAIGSDGVNLWKAKPPPVKVVNTIGSGDALLGGLIFALLKEMPLDEALKFAVATGTANTLVDGPCYVDPQDIHEILSATSVRAW